MQIITASSISHAIQSAIDLIADWASDDPQYCWFRGVNDSSLSLQPGACWRQNYTELSPLLDLVQQGVSFANVGRLDQWDTYYFAQHHGIPTRLLDWTNSFTAALFFAFDGWDEKTTPCVWILQPTVLNQVFIKWKGVIAPEVSPTNSLRIWLPTEIAKREAISITEDETTYDNQWPIAIYPKTSNARIAAQQGSFTVHGRRSDSLDQLISDAGSEPGDVLAKILLTGFSNSQVVQELGLLGIRRSSIYPDVINFVRQLKDYYKW